MASSEYRPPRRLTGSETFHESGRVLSFDVLDFWRWSSSDLVSNTLRGQLAEYLVAQALDLTADCRVEWGACDLRTPDGINVEVKSSAYVQSWVQNRPSVISFGIQPSYGWDPVTNTSLPERRRSADVYVFCVLHHADRTTLDPLNVDQWSFYVLSTAILNEKLPQQKTISLSALLALAPAVCRYGELRDAVHKAAAGRTPDPHA
jgi:hypothetical protein